MQKIIRSYVVITAVILCLTLLVTGLISVNEETSYVISGEREDVLRVQSTTSERLIISENGNTVTESKKLTLPDKESVFMILSGLLPSPFSQIIWSLI